MIDKIIKIIKNYTEKSKSTIKRKNNNNISRTTNVRKRELILKKEMIDWLNNNLKEFNEEYKYYDLNCCPNCGVILDKKVETSKNCPTCKKKIIVRTNKENKKRLILSNERVKQYDKDDEKRKEILFLDKQMSSLNLMFPEYMYKFYETKTEKPDMSARDYVFSFENWLFNELDKNTYKEYQKAFNLKNEQDKIYNCDRAIWGFKSANNVFRFMAELTKYEGKEDILLGMIVTLLYRNMTLAHLPYYHWPDRPFDEITFWSDSFDCCMYLAIDYIQRHNIKFEDLKDDFMQRAHPLILDILPKEKAWDLIVKSYYRYTKLMKNK